MSNVQRQMLEAGYGKSTVALPMPCHGFQSPDTGPSKHQGQKPLNVVWVGRLSAEKRVEWLLDVAEKCTAATFTIIGAPNEESAYAREAVRRAEAMPNVQFVGRIPYEKMAEFYNDANVLCCTSVYEGFPNVYLEAWSVGVPVVTTIDPDEIITQNNTGVHCETVEAISAALNTLQDDPNLLEALSASSRSYFRDHHEVDSAMGAFNDYFRQVVPDE